MHFFFRHKMVFKSVTFLFATGTHSSPFLALPGARCLHSSSPNHKRDYYSVLGVSKDSDQSAIKKAYYKVECLDSQVRIAAVFFFYLQALHTFYFFISIVCMLSSVCVCVCVCARDFVCMCFCHVLYKDVC